MGLSGKGGPGGGPAFTILNDIVLHILYCTVHSVAITNQLEALLERESWGLV